MALLCVTENYNNGAIYGNFLFPFWRKIIAQQLFKNIKIRNRKLSAFNDCSTHSIPRYGFVVPLS